MLTIEVRVPAETDVIQSDKIRMLIRVALAELKITQDQTTVEFIPCHNPERLIINYRTNSGRELLLNDNLNKHAKAVGQVVESVLKLPVVCFVAFFANEATGIYLTPN